MCLRSSVRKAVCVNIGRMSGNHASLQTTSVSFTLFNTRLTKPRVSMPVKVVAVRGEDSNFNVQEYLQEQATIPLHGERIPVQARKI